MTLPNVERSGFSGRRPKPSRTPVRLFLLFLLITGALVLGYMLARPRVEFTNGLRAPVRIAVAESPPRSVPPGHSIRVPLPSGESTLVIWELVRPLSADGKPMGEEIRGSILVPAKWGTVPGRAAARSSGGNYFAPLITNASDDLLRVVVNAGLEGSRDCGCAVRPGATRAFIGYYRLYQNSTVQVRTGDGRSAAFRDLGSRVVARDGAIGLRFEGKDLRAP